MSSGTLTGTQPTTTTDTPPPAAPSGNTGLTAAFIVTTSITALTVVGLVVLIALGKITWGDGGPLIAALAGVHGGATLTRTA